MVYPQNFLRLVVSGTLYDVEAFSYSIALVDVEDNATPPTEVPAAIITAVTNWHTTGVPAVANVAKMNMIKLNEIGPDGKYTHGTTVQHEFTTPVPGPGTNYVAAQVALAISLRTPLKRGRAHAGRFYVPVPTTGVIVTGAYSTNNVLTIVNAAKTFIDALNAALPPYKVAVMSNIGTGTYQIVTGVRVGGVPDTIRSRREKIPEAYQEVAIS